MEKKGNPSGAAGLGEYRRLQRRMAESEARLAEYCAAIEEFGLYAGSPALADPRPIHCTMGDLTPAALCAAAREEAARLEALGAAAPAARGRVQTRILRRSRDLAHYRALCRRYVDDP